MHIMKITVGSIHTWKGAQFQAIYKTKDGLDFCRETLGCLNGNIAAARQEAINRWNRAPKDIHQAIREVVIERW